MTEPEIWVMESRPFEPDLLAKIREVGAVKTFAPGDAARFRSSIANAQAIVGVVPCDAAVFDAAPKLKVISTVSVGFNHIDIDEATRRGVLVCHTPGVLNRAVTDLTMALIFSLALRLFENETFVRSGRWAAREPNPPLGSDIRDKTLGIIGFGRIGQDVTTRMQQLGMRTIWYDRYTGPFDNAPKSEFRPLDDLLAESDFVSLHTNWEPGMAPILGAREFGLMKASAYFVNTARGPLVDQAALTDALENGSIAGAGLDVLHDEPPSADERIVTLPNVVCFPHIGSATEETRRAMRELAVENLLAALAGHMPPAPVNPEVLT